ncbi:MAG: ATP-binding protein [Chloroflexales bacterium]|nr:ATP-binding protein [Chloroflexales bacterium]
MIEPMAFGGALATDLVGRDEELATIYKTIGADAGTEFRCLLLMAEGGKGKTRLLQAVASYLQPPARPEQIHPAPWNTVSVLAPPLIDVGDPYLHALVPFLRAVREGFGTLHQFDAAQSFAAFDEALERYEQAADMGRSYKEINTLASAVAEAFRGDYQQLTRSVRVVWFIDTLEQLFMLPPELVDLADAVRASISDQTTFIWLLQLISSAPANTTLILAGRPAPPHQSATQPASPPAAPPRWVREILEYVSLVHGAPGAVAETIPPMFDEHRPDDKDERARLQLSASGAIDHALGRELVSVLELLPFSPDDVRAYLLALERQLQSDSSQRSHPTLARYLKPLIDGDDWRLILHRLTHGNPILLAIYVDLLLNGDLVPEAFTYAPDAFARLDQAAQARVTKEVNRDLLIYLSRGLSRPEAQVLEYLSIMRRGLDQERLVRLWGGEAEQAGQTLGYLRRLSFVKIGLRNKLFLHDEIYRIYQEGYSDETRESREARLEIQRSIFQTLIDYCDEQVELCTQTITRLDEQLHDIDRDKEEQRANPDAAQRDAELKHQLREQRQRRQRLRAEQLHYSLYLDPVNAFNNVYFDLAEQAFAANDLDLYAQLQSEIDLFFFSPNADLNREQTDMTPRAWDQLRFAVIYERVSGLIKRLIKAPDYERAIKLAAEAYDRHAAALDRHYASSGILMVRETGEGRVLDRLYRLEWQSLGSYAAIFHGRDVGEQVAQLEKIVESLEAFLRGEPAGELPPFELSAYRKRVLNVLAQSLRFAGYGSATLNNFDMASSIYQRADRILGFTGLDVLQAEVKNDRSRVLGELGALYEALSVSDQAVAIRRRLGFDYLLGLSYSTKALIYVSNVRPNEGLAFAQLAIERFRRAQDVRGIGLALRHAAEARRRIWNLLPEEVRPRHLELLDDAKRDLLEAEQIFSDSAERVRLLAIRMELGCLYRDRARFFRLSPDHEIVQSALGYLEQVARDAQTNNYIAYQLGALVNKAWLYFSSAAYALADQAAKEALEAAPQKYVLNPDWPISRSERDNAVIYRELSKLYSLRGALLEAQVGAYHELFGEKREWLPELLSHYILSITYAQLFSPHDRWDLGFSKRQFYDLLTRLIVFGQLAVDTVRSQIDVITSLYQLRSVGVMHLQYEQIVEEVFADKRGLDYLD